VIVKFLFFSSKLIFPFSYEVNGKINLDFGMKIFVKAILEWPFFIIFIKKEKIYPKKDV